MKEPKNRKPQGQSAFELELEKRRRIEERQDRKQHPDNYCGMADILLLAQMNLQRKTNGQERLTEAEGDAICAEARKMVESAREQPPSPRKTSGLESMADIAQGMVQKKSEPDSGGW